MSGIWKKFNPANDLYDQPLAYRGTIAPFGTYTNPDGSESADWDGSVFSDTGRPSIAGATAASADQDEISLDEFLRRYGVTY